MGRVGWVAAGLWGFAGVVVAGAVGADAEGVAGCGLTAVLGAAGLRGDCGGRDCDEIACGGRLQ